MQQSPKSYVAFVLDTKAECQVIDAAFQDETFVMSHDFFKPNVPSSATGTKIRFESEAKRASKALELPSNGRLIISPLTGQPIQMPEGMKDHPRFEVWYDDLHFVQKAAERIIVERKPLEVARNRVSGRYTAAANMLVSVSRILNDEIVLYNSLDSRAD